MSEPSSTPTTEIPVTFASLPLTAEVHKALAEMGYLHPTPVQVACYEPVIRGKDVMVQARTGTGKTTAFGLPLVDQVVRRQPGLQALILCPTRELALQVASEIGKLGAHRGLQIVAVYGGAPMGRQIAELEGGAQIVVGTPGRVLDHLRRGTMDASGIRTFVLDEADEMLSMGFEKELNAIVERIPAGRQTLLFSATLSSDVSRIVRDMKDPEKVLLSGDHVGALELTHYFYLQTGDKVRDLLRVLEIEDPPSAILFCNTKDETERVARELHKAGYAADYISGDLEQAAREKVMARVRDGQLRFLVATDVAARGIDISHLTHVINVDFPEAQEQYVHRTGRTGRAGRTGTAISLLSPKAIGSLYYLRLTYGIRPIERAIPDEREITARREADLLSVVEKLPRAAAAADLRSLARRVLAHDDAEALVASLLTHALGPTLAPLEDAQKARRARTDPETKVEAPAPPRETRASTRESPRGRDDRPRRDDRERAPRGPRHADLAKWEPKAEPDDDSLLLPGYKISDPKPEAAAAKPANKEAGVQEQAASDVPSATVFVNSGKRDGITGQDLLAVLEGRGAIEADAVVAIRLRDRNAFVDVRPDVLDRAVAALTGAELKGRKLRAEPARKVGSP